MTARKFLFEETIDKHLVFDRVVLLKRSEKKQFQGTKKNGANVSDKSLVVSVPSYQLLFCRSRKTTSTSTANKNDSFNTKLYFPFERDHQRAERPLQIARQELVDRLCVFSADADEKNPKKYFYEYLFKNKNKKTIFTNDNPT